MIRRAALALLLASGLSVATVSAATAATYYVSPTGSDAASGRSRLTPWRTLARASRQDLLPGDVLALEGGARFAGQLTLDAADAGQAADPVTVRSYGQGRARIDAGQGTGIGIDRTAGVVIQDLDVAGSGVATNTGDGIDVYNDLPGDVLLEGVTIRRVDVGGFGRYGIAVGGWNGASGYRDVRIAGSTAHANGASGIIVYARQRAVNRNVVVTHDRATGNPGIPGATSPTGNGIVLGGVAGGAVRYSVADHNGGSNDASAGPVGIWTYDSDSVVIEHCESYANRTGGPSDGGGFDLDQGTSHSVLRFDYSHGNDGAGLLSSEGTDSGVRSGNAMRFNVSQDDGRRNGYAAIMVWGPAGDLQADHNTVFVSPAAATPAAVQLGGLVAPVPPASPARFRNNVLLTTGGTPLVRWTGRPVTSAARFQGNDYAAVNGAFHIQWGAGYGSLAAWRQATGEETLGGAPTGLAADPGLPAPGRAPAYGDPARLPQLAAYYSPPAGSPVVDAGLDLVRGFGVRADAADFIGTPVPSGAGEDIGAFERPQ